MNLSFGLFGRRRRMVSGDGQSSIRPEHYVVARWVKAAPSAWVFFDGAETVTKERSGKSVLVPGGAFFLDEARPYASSEQAKAQARRLNALAPSDESWVAIAAHRVITSLAGFTPLVDITGKRGGATQ